MNRSMLLLSMLAFAYPSISVSQKNTPPLDCHALSNSADAAPPGYAEQCLSTSSDNKSGEFVAPFGAPTNLAYTIDLRGQTPRLPNSLYSFTLDAFSSQSLIDAVPQTNIFAMDFNADGSILYAATGNAAPLNPSTLGIVNTATAAFTVIAPLSGLQAGDNTSGITIDPVTDVAYLSAAGGTPTPTSRLYTLNLATGAVTLIGQMTAPTDAAGTLFIDIAINCQGQLYGHNISDDALYSINPDTGAGTLIGTHGLAANFAQGMDFDNADGTLYGFVYTGAGTNRFGHFDLDTGAFTTLAQDNPLGEFEGAIPNTCEPLPIEIFADGFETLL